MKEKLNQLIKQLLNKEPNVVHMFCDYYGEGDSFEDFNGIDLYDENEENIKVSNDVFPILKEIFWLIIEADGRSSFVNDGSSGEIEINLNTGRIKINVSCYEKVTHSLGENNYEDLIPSKEPDEEV